MKKTVSVLLAAVLLFSLTACSSAAKTQPAPQQTQESVTETAVPHPAEALEQEPAVTANVSEESESEILVLFFSRTGEQYNVGVIEKGNTAIVAEMIAESIGADLYEILPADDHYPTTYKELTDVGLQEQRDGARPAYEGELPDFENYDTIFIGAPVWWGVAAWPIDDFLTSNDFTGKKLAAFVTSASSSFGNESDVKDMAKGAQWLGGKRFPSSASDSAIRSWLESLAL